MDKNSAMSEALERIAQRRSDRREFLRVVRNSGAAVAGATVLSACSGGGRDDPPSEPPSVGPQVDDVAILNFALNLEYLEAQFYHFAAFGMGLPQSLLTGQGTQGGVTGGRQVNFTDPIVRLYANEIAQDERDHVEFLRAALGSAAVAQPPIDISGDPNGPFSAAARAAGLVGPGQAFDPYASDENFLLGAFIFEDVGVTAYKGAAPLITNKTFLEAAAGILAAEAYHASLIRTTLFRKGVEQMQSLITATERISDARDSLDSPASDKDQGIAPRNGGSNIVPADENAIAYSRTPGDVLNIVYLTAAAASQGGFFPRGVNGVLTRSSAG
jgi:hypothetical protein